MFDSGFSFGPHFDTLLLERFYDILPNLIQSEASEEYSPEVANLDARDTSNHFYTYDANCLCDAARCGDMNLANACLRAGVSINARNEHGSALYQACLHSQTNMIHFLSQQGATIDSDLDQEWRTPSIVAVCNDDIDMISQLLTIGTLYKPEAFVSGMFSPVRLAVRLDKVRIMEMLLIARIIDWSVSDLNLALEFALERRNLRMIRLFLDAGADVDHSLHYGDTALMIAVEFDDVSMTNFLLGIGAEPNCHIWAYDGDRRCLQSLLRKAVSEGNIEIVKLLLKAGAKVNNNYSSHHHASLETPLRAAFRNGNQELVRLLLNAGAEINAPGTSFEGGKTTLQMAAAHGHVDLVRQLLGSGADVNAPAAGFGGRTALQAAADHGDYDLVKLLLVAGADVNAPAANHHGRPALEAAAQNGDYDLVKLLLDAGADVNTPAAGNYGITALRAAAEYGDCNLVKLLLDAGADVNTPAVGDFGTTALQAAALKGDRNLVKILLDAGADVNAPAAGAFGRTALQAAAQNGDVEVIQLLLDAGADVDAPAAQLEGITAFQAAVNYGGYDLMKLLLDAGADPNGQYSVRTALGCAIS
jgi:ankyrin repeat protein